MSPDYKFSNSLCSKSEESAEEMRPTPPFLLCIQLPNIPWVPDVMIITNTSFVNCLLCAQDPNMTPVSLKKPRWLEKFKLSAVAQAQAEMYLQALKQRKVCLTKRQRKWQIISPSTDVFHLETLLTIVCCPLFLPLSHYSLHSLLLNYAPPNPHPAHHI